MHVYICNDATNVVWGQLRVSVNPGWFSQSLPPDTMVATPRHLLVIIMESFWAMADSKALF